MTEQDMREIEEILERVKRNKEKLENGRQCYTCALGHCGDDCGGFYCDRAADDYDCDEEGCSNYKDGTPSYAKIDEDDLQTILDLLPVLLAEVKRLRSELEAAKKDITQFTDAYYPCCICKHWTGEKTNDCKISKENSCDFEWRGVKESE